MGLRYYWPVGPTAVTTICSSLRTDLYGCEPLLFPTALAGPPNLSHFLHKKKWWLEMLYTHCNYFVVLTSLFTGCGKWRAKWHHSLPFDLTSTQLTSFLLQWNSFRLSWKIPTSNSLGIKDISGDFNVNLQFHLYLDGWNLPLKKEAWDGYRVASDACNYMPNALNWEERAGIHVILDLLCCRDMWSVT